MFILFYPVRFLVILITRIMIVFIGNQVKDANLIWFPDRNTAYIDRYKTNGIPEIAYGFALWGKVGSRVYSDSVSISIFRFRIFLKKDAFFFGRLRTPLE